MKAGTTWKTTSSEFPAGQGSAVSDARPAPRFPYSPDGGSARDGAFDWVKVAMQDSDSPAPRRKRRVSEQTPVQRALGLLVRREHSRKELTRKLQARGIETEAAVAAVDTLSEAGWQDDTRFAENLVRIRANTGYGPIHIRAELGTHGLDSEQIALAMDTFEGDWAENARDLVCRRFGEAGPQELPQRRKAADLLARRGFDGDTIRRATRYDPDD